VPAGASRPAGTPVPSAQLLEPHSSASPPVLLHCVHHGFQDCWVQLIMVAATVQASSSAVGMDPRSVGNPYFTHTFEALTPKVRVTSRRHIII